jgi:outer membrane protein assembly factor BamB
MTVRSSMGEYIAISKIPTEYDPENIGGAIYKSDGTLVWKIDKGPSPLSINDEGYVVAAYKDWGAYAPGDFVFYNPAGNEIGRIENPLLKKGYEIGCGNARFTPNGEYIVLGFTHLGQKTIMILTTKRGKILWKKEFDYRSWFPYESAILENVGIIGIWDQLKPRQTYTYFIDWQGNLKWMVPLNTRGNMIVRFSEGKRKVFISATAGYLFCIDVQSGKLLWKYKMEWAPKEGIPVQPVLNVPWFCEMNIVRNYIYIVGKYMNRNVDWFSSAILIFDTNTGTLLKKIEYPEKKIYLQSSKDRLFIIDATSNKVSLFEVE